LTAGLAIGYPTQNGAALVGLLSTLPLAGSIIGYELSSHPSRRRANEARAREQHARDLARVHVSPALSPTSVGIMGVF
jgi:hypothetical protein